MKNSFEKEFNLGGSIETALSGQYELKVNNVFREAMSYTIKHFWSFTPAILILLVINAIMIFVAVRLQVSDFSMLVNALEEPANASMKIWQILEIAKASSQVINAPLYAGVCLMAMSHAAGLKTHTSYMAKGLQYTIPTIIFAIGCLLMKLAASFIFVPLSLYVTIVLSQAILLICEKRIPVIQAMLLSFKGVNKKLLPIVALYLIVFAMFLCALWLYFISIICVVAGVIFVLPFYLHVNGIIYRNMFGITLVIISPTDKNEPKVFNA